MLASVTAKTSGVQITPRTGGVLNIKIVRRPRRKGQAGKQQKSRPADTIRCKVNGEWIEFKLDRS